MSDSRTLPAMMPRTARTGEAHAWADDRSARIGERFARTGDHTLAADERFALGDADLDARLGGGLARHRLHEVYAAVEADIASATGFALMLALRAAPPATTILWIAQDAARAAGGGLHAPGLAALGADPARMLFVDAADAAAVLRVAADALRSGAPGAVVLATWGAAPMLDLTASRRLMLHAERAGVTAILLRGRAEPAPSAATTRWRVGAASSSPMEAEMPGRPAFAVELLRNRSGLPPAHWRWEWDRDDLAFRNAPLPGAAPALAPGGRVGVAAG